MPRSGPSAGAAAAASVAAAGRAVAAGGGVARSAKGDAGVEVEAAKSSGAKGGGSPSPPPSPPPTSTPAGGQAGRGLGVTGSTVVAVGGVEEGASASSVGAATTPLSGDSADASVRSPRNTSRGGDEGGGAAAASAAVLAASSTRSRAGGGATGATPSVGGGASALERGTTRGVGARRRGEARRGAGRCRVDRLTPRIEGVARCVCGAGRVQRGRAVQPSAMVRPRSSAKAVCAPFPPDAAMRASRG